MKEKPKDNQEEIPKIGRLNGKSLVVSGRLNLWATGVLSTNNKCGTWNSFIIKALK